MARRVITASSRLLVVGMLSLAGCATWPQSPTPIVLNRTGIPDGQRPPTQPLPSDEPAFTAKPAEPTLSDQQDESNLLPLQPIQPPSGGGPRMVVPHGATAANLDLAVTAPMTKQVGSRVTFRLSVTNRGSERVDNIALTGEFDEALQFPAAPERRVTQRLGSLVAGESREVALTLLARAPGTQCSRFTLTVDGMELVWKSVCVEVVPRQLAVTVIGPSQRTVGSRAEFNFKLVNVTPRVLNDVQATVSFDPALVPREITTGGEVADGRIRWKVGALQPGEGVQLQIEFEAATPSEQACFQIETTGQNLPPDDAEHCLEITAVKGPLDVRVEDAPDPVKVGTETEYVITVRNRGTEPVRGLRLHAQVSKAVRMLSATVRVDDNPQTLTYRHQDQQLAFDPVKALAPEGRLEYRIRAQALQPGDIEFRVRVTTDSTSEPWEVAEPTTIYE